jgi:Protein of unknown function (DUF736)
MAAREVSVFSMGQEAASVVQKGKPSRTPGPRNAGEVASSRRTGSSIDPRRERAASIACCAAAELVPVDKMSDNGPDHRVYAGQRYEVGAGGANTSLPKLAYVIPTF